MKTPQHAVLMHITMSFASILIGTNVILTATQYMQPTSLVPPYVVLATRAINTQSGDTIATRFGRIPKQSTTHP